MTQRQSQKAWIVRISPEEYRQLSLERDIIAVGWSNARDLNKISDWLQFKEHLREHYSDMYESNRALGNAAGSLWRFIHEIQPGDLVLVPGPETFYLAEVESDIEWSEPDASADFSWQRRVVWRAKEPISRSKSDNYLRRRMKARQTCVDASDLITEISEAFDRKDDLSLVNEIRHAVLMKVMEKIDHVVDHRGLEYLVCALVQASGLHAEVLPTRQNEEGDVDVLANMKVPAPNRIHGGITEIRVGYQVKHHDGQTGMQGLEQISTAVDGGKIDYGFLVTSADEFDEEVKMLVSDASDQGARDQSHAVSSEASDVYGSIGLIDRKSLAEWLLDVGLENGDLEKIKI